MTDVIIEAKNLTKSYTMSKTNTVHALKGVDLKIHRGDFAAIVGPSGCGKSTLLHMLGLLDTPDNGTITIDGQEVHALTETQTTKLRAKKIGFVFQGFNLIPSLTALENVMLAGRYGGLARAERKSRATRLLTDLGLNERLNHRPNELSGGQHQRVALARALMNNPSLILADEPTGELDTTTSLEIIDLLKKLNRDEGRTFVIVTHNHEVAAVCQRTIRLRDGKNAD